MWFLRSISKGFPVGCPKFKRSMGPKIVVVGVDKRSEEGGPLTLVMIRVGGWGLKVPPYFYL